MEDLFLERGKRYLGPQVSNSLCGVDQRRKRHNVREWSGEKGPKVPVLPQQDSELIIWILRSRPGLSELLSSPLALSFQHSALPCEDEDQRNPCK